MPSLKLALIHSRVDHKQPELNRKNLLTLFRQAGEKGAHLVVGPELSISGYSFNSRQDIAPYAETATGPTLTALADLARTYGFFACIGLAEHDTQTGILYNSAFVVGPTGEIVCRYRKINAESRWACSGNPKEDNTFATPWGRVGVLVCSDSYHSLMPRVTALRGANLLLILANWPPSGVDPAELWRARALENGFSVAACNRTGMDLAMDCHQATSAVVDDHGTMLLNEHHQQSTIIMTSLPLQADNQLKAAQRLGKMASRHWPGMHDCCLNLSAIMDLTSFLQLPTPGPLLISCIVVGAQEQAVAALQAANTDRDQLPDTLSLLPALGYSDATLNQIQACCAVSGQRVALCRETPQGSTFFWFDGALAPQQISWNLSPDSALDALPRFDCGPARVLLAPFASLYHPEVALAAAKQGCDLAIACERLLSEEDRLVAGARTIDNLAIAACSTEGGGIWMTPGGHQRWEEQLAGPRESCRFVLDTNRTRKKRFQDRIDFETLFHGATG
ncbi:MAG: carbon-nitrogen hydrolase family protein [Desulfobulbus sp.]|nr:carbon-nitrogen hydrolase family protein [Desulfobulbus sp.]